MPATPYGPRLRHGAYIGNRETSEHSTWRTIIARCTAPSSKDYPRYGGRGIGICAEWLDYATFLADMGPRPSKQHTVERLNNEMGYSPSNCCWATHSEQQKNRRSTRRYQRGLLIGTLVEWADELGISKELAHWRMKTWGTFERGSSWLELPKQS